MVECATLVRYNKPRNLTKFPRKILCIHHFYVSCLLSVEWVDSFMLSGKRKFVACKGCLLLEVIFSYRSIFMSRWVQWEPSLVKYSACYETKLLMCKCNTTPNKFSAKIKDWTRNCSTFICDLSALFLQYKKLMQGRCQWVKLFPTIV